MNKKAIFATVLVVQLILLILLTFSMIRSERVQFEYEINYMLLSAYKFADMTDNIQYELEYLESKYATNKTFNEFLTMVNYTYSNYFFINFEINRTYIKLGDSNLELAKEVSLT